MAVSGAWRLGRAGLTRVFLNTSTVIYLAGGNADRRRRSDCEDIQHVHLNGS